MSGSIDVAQTVIPTTAAHIQCCTTPSKFINLFLIPVNLTFNIQSSISNLDNHQIKDTNTVMHLLMIALEYIYCSLRL
jgi:hypothetical protein